MPNSSIGSGSAGASGTYYGGGGGGSVSVSLINPGSGYTGASVVTLGGGGGSSPTWVVFADYKIKQDKENPLTFLINERKADVAGIIKWFVKVGVGPKNWDTDCNTCVTTVEFETAKDATLFKLAWYEE
jgi:hypothetical protein